MTEHHGNGHRPSQRAIDLFDRYTHGGMNRRDFLDRLRDRTQVVILSDTFEQFGAPLMRHLGMPTILCHQLIVRDDRIVDYRLRMPDQKRHAVNAFRGLNYR